MFKKALLLSSAALYSLGAHAEFGVGPKVGTLGFGIEGQYAFNDRFGVRASFNAFDYSWDDELDGVSYDGDLALSSSLLVLDYRPTGGAFRITGGVLLNGNEVEGVADPAATYGIGNNDYTLDEVGELSAIAEFDSVAPYLGIGFDLRRDAALRISFDAGVAFQGEPDISISSRGGTRSTDPALRADLDQEEAAFRDDLDDFDVYPVLSIGISYAFR